MPSTQNYANHRRWSPIHHFIAYPVAGIGVALAAQAAWQEPTRANIALVAIALAVPFALLSARVMALTVQNRVIRLEMRIRLKEVLPPALAARAVDLRVRHLVGLRYAGDAELPGLVERCLKGEFETSDQIKQAVTDWQPDFLRA
jgi:hypothetical protein